MLTADALVVCAGMEGVLKEWGVLPAILVNSDGVP